MGNTVIIETVLVLFKGDVLSYVVLLNKGRSLSTSKGRWCLAPFGRNKIRKEVVYFMECWGGAIVTDQSSLKALTLLLGRLYTGN